MARIQENPTSKALLVQIPKAIAKAKGIKKGDEIEFLIDQKGRLILDIKKHNGVKNCETNNTGTNI